jgi:methylmalonyl-CoA mutase C-terminal domain/subunit
VSELKIRVLVGKPGLDGHDRGAKIVATALRDPAMIAEVAVQEDVDVVGLSILSGAHMTLFPRVRKELDARGMGHVLLTGGGIIPGEDMTELQQDGYTKLFGPGTPTEEIAQWIRVEMERRQAEQKSGTDA